MNKENRPYDARMDTALTLALTIELRPVGGYTRYIVTAYTRIFIEF